MRVYVSMQPCGMCVCVCVCVYVLTRYVMIMLYTVRTCRGVDCYMWLSRCNQALDHLSSHTALAQGSVESFLGPVSNNSFKAVHINFFVCFTESAFF